jgi:hypothetical protein
MQLKIKYLLTVSTLILGLTINQASFAASATTDLRPGFYLSAGYTYAHIKNAGLTNLKVLSPLGILPIGSFPDRSTYDTSTADGQGFNIAFGQLVTQHFGYELHYIHATKTQSANFQGYVQITPLDNVPKDNSLITLEANQKTQINIAEFLGTVALQLDRNVALLLKAGLAYEWTKFSYTSHGVALAPEEDPGPSGIINESYDTNKNGLAGAGAIELRYYMNQHLALNLAVNGVTGKNKMLAGNAGLLYAF